MERACRLFTVICGLCGIVLVLDFSIWDKSNSAAPKKQLILKSMSKCDPMQHDLYAISAVLQKLLAIDIQSSKHAPDMTCLAV